LYKNKYLIGHVIKQPLLPFLLGIKNKLFYPIRSLKRILAFNAWSITSKYDPEQNIRLLFLGGETVKNYICSLVFNENYNEIHHGKVPIWRLFFFLRRFKNNYDLLIVQNMAKICNLFKSENNFVIPDWVGCEIDLCRDIKECSISKRTLKSNIKKIKKNNLEYTITKDPFYFQFFYNNMYLPYISKRHGNTAIIISFDKMKRSFENGELLLIKDGQEIIAGVILDYKVMNGIPRTTQLGVLEGDSFYVKRGAIIAIYYYTIEYLKKQNFKKFNVGSSRPFFNDGVLNHKLRWGAKVVCETSDAFLFCLLSNRKCVKTFLVNNPFFCKDRKRLTLEIFSDDNFKACQNSPKSEKKFISGVSIHRQILSPI